MNTLLDSVPPEVDLPPGSAGVGSEDQSIGHDSVVPEMTCSVYPKNVLLLLLLLISGFVVAGILANVAIARVEPGSHRGLMEIVDRFDLDNELNVPTWYASTTLTCCALLLAVIFLASKHSRSRYALHWGFLALIFLYLSIDEAANLHEILITPLRRRLDLHGFLHFSWVIPGAACVCAFVLAYLKFLFHLDKRTRLLFVVSGAIYIGGALGLEMVGGAFAEWYGMKSLCYLAVATAEETMEMLGIAVFIYTLLSYIQNRVGRMKICLADAAPPRAESQLAGLRPVRITRPRRESGP